MSRDLDAFATALLSEEQLDAVEHLAKITTACSAEVALQLCATIRALEAENVRLREALREARPLMIKPSDTGRHRKAVAARIDALLSEGGRG